MNSKYVSSIKDHNLVKCVLRIHVATSIQLFRQRLSHEGVEVYATMSIGIMGSRSLALLDRGLR